MKIAVFLENLRQQKKTALIIAAMYLSCVLFFLIYNKYNGSGYYTLESLLEFLNMAALAAGTMVFTTGRFTWLYSGAAADCYYQLPIKKWKLAAGSLLSALCMSLLLAAFIQAINVTGLDIFEKGYYPEKDVLFDSALLQLKLVLFMMGVSFLAVVLAGSLETCGVMVIMLAIAPSLFVILTQGAISANLERYVPNILTGEFADASGAGSSLRSVLRYTLEMFTGSGIMSFLAVLSVSLLYLLLACFVFMGRKAETSGKSAVSGRAHAVCRMIPALVTSIFMTALVIRKIKHPELIFSMTGRRFAIICAVLAVYLLSAALIYAYEFAVARKVTGFKRLWPQVLMLAAINLVYLVSSLAVHRAIQYDVPSSAQIEYVTIDSVDRAETNYFANALSTYWLSGDELKTLVSDSLEFTANFFDSYETGYPNGNEYRFFVITIHKRFGSVKRKIFFDEDSAQRLLALVEEEGVFDEIVDELPDSNDEVDIRAVTGKEFRLDDHSYLARMSTAAIDKFLKLYCEDIRSAGLEKAIAINEDQDYMFVLYHGSVGGGLPLDERTPEASEYFLREISGWGNKR